MNEKLKLAAVTVVVTGLNVGYNELTGDELALECTNGGTPIDVVPPKVDPAPTETLPDHE